jgi:hypothetical protein
MRIAIAAVLAAAVGGLAVTADAAPARKQQRYAATKEKVQVPRAQRENEYGFDQSPDHYPVGSNEWWRAMDREGRGGCCGTTN